MVVYMKETEKSLERSGYFSYCDKAPGSVGSGVFSYSFLS